MKFLLRRWLFVLFLLSSIFSAVSVNAQDWSDEQKAVWKEVETYWDLYSKGDLEGFINYFHEDYMGWYNRSTLPGDKKSLKKWLKPMMELEKTLVFEIKPVGIFVEGNVAVVHYYYSQLSKQGPEKMEHEQGRWTDILMKKGGKWKVVGDHGGPQIGK